jgi:hypothetical protein
MRKLFVAALLVAVAPPAWRVAEACGDKFLLVGRGLRLQRAYAAVHPGNILIFAKPSTKESAAIRDPQFQKNLRQAGHALSVIEDLGLFEQALGSGSFDIVLADVAEAPRIDRLVAAAPSRPTPLYVAYPSAFKDKALQEQYLCTLKATDRPIRFLDRIESEMKTRAPKRASKG